MNFINDLFSRLIQAIMFWWVRVGDNPHHTDVSALNKQLADGKQLIYVLEHNSLADLLVLDRQCRKHGLPSALERIDDGEMQGRRPLLAIRDRKPLFGRGEDQLADNLERLLSELDEDPDSDFILLPVALYWGRAADNSTNPIKVLLDSNWKMMGRFKKFLTVLINGRNTYFEINDPVSLRSLVETESDSSSEDYSLLVKKISRLMKVHFRRVRAAVIGPDMSSKRLLAGKVMHSDHIRGAIAQYAEEQGISEDEAARLARKHFDAIAADLTNTAVRFLSAIMSWVWNKIYHGIEMRGIESVRELAKDYSLVFAPCHRSHIDYLLLSYQLYHHGLNVPHIVAGENLNMPVVGRILRGCGAFFIRRSFGGDKLYTAVFNEYLHNLFTSGFSVEYFVEGGRSRTGRSLKPATGTLAMTVRSHLRDNTKPIVIVPVYIGYEKVFESSSYQGELRGKSKKKENLFDLAKTVNKLKNNGKVYLNFGEAIHLNNLLDNEQPKWRETTYGPDDKPEWLPGFVNQLATLLVTRINAAAALNPVNMVATALLATSRQAIDGRLLKKHLALLLEMQQVHGYNEHTSLPLGDVDEWIEYTGSMEYLHHIPQPLGDLYGLSSKSTVSMSYYRNNVQHLFALPSLVATLVAQGDGASLYLLQRRMRQVYPYIRNELFLMPTVEEAVDSVELWLQFFAERQLVTCDDDRWFAPEKGQVTRLQLELLVNITLPALERYFIGLSVLVRFGSGQCQADELEQQSQLMAQRLSLLNGLDAPEFFDKTLFRRFIEALRKASVITVNDDGVIEFDSELQSQLEDANKLLPVEVVYNVMQVADLPD
ncbi:glycerol-3-phosphate 1-O-acyltransferase PlsB [Candidatus Pelagadaptatus aseana]|uniref:glycerol-3-phosphate 1-O-acyltransferase PlsB n=1 Tax=Candidatus Pelagadaptatus aseana TaxID=3120508 RepID=UPI003C700588